MSMLVNRRLTMVTATGQSAIANAMLSTGIFGCLRIRS